MDQSERDQFERYRRQMSFPAWGEAGQRKLAAARVGIVGCGGLGSVLATHLTRAGVGFLRLIDEDRVSFHNLHRQILYFEEDVESDIQKVEIAAVRLRAMNHRVQVESMASMLDDGNGDDFAAGLDLILDGTDNFAARFLINQLAVARGIPWIYGGVLGATGMTMSIFPGDGPCLRCLFPDTPTGSTAGTHPPPVINTIVALIASLQVNEAYKIILGQQPCNRDLVLFDLWDCSFTQVPVSRDPGCPACG